MTPIIVVLLCTSPRSLQCHTPDENGYLCVPETNTVAQGFPYRSPDSLPQMPGWPIVININFPWLPTGATLADVDEDGYLEILVGSTDGSFHVLNYQGTELPGWPKTGLDGLWSKPAVGDIDPTYPGLEVVAAGANTTLYCWHFDGSSVPGWPQSADATGRLKSPVIYDIDDNGDLEIILGQRYYPDGRVLIFNHDGTAYPGWPQYLSYMCVATPSVADIDADGEIEICAADYNGLFLWDKDGNLEPGWPILNADWRSSYAQPVLADLDGDGDLEILAEYDYGPPIFQTYVGIYHHDGTNFTNWPQKFTGPQSFTTPVVADIDDDGDLEIFGGGHCTAPLPDLLARHHTGDTVSGWPVPVGLMECTPAVLDLDLDDNGKREILVNDNTLYPYGSFYAYNDDGTLVPGFPLASGASTPNSPSVGDVDADGDIEIAFVAESLVYLWTVPDVQYRPYMVEWGTWFHDNWNTGWFHPKAPQNLSATSSPSSVHLNWDANTEPDIAGYNVYRSENSGPPYAKINDTIVIGTTYTDVPPVGGILYFYCVTAQIKACTESRLSNEVSGGVGVEEHASASIPLFSVSPNPFTNVVNFNTSSEQSSTIKIYDSKGALVDVIEAKGSVQWKPQEYLPAGVYFLRVSSQDEDQVTPVVLLR